MKKKEDEQPQAGADGQAMTTSTDTGQPSAQEREADGTMGILPPIAGVRISFICVSVAHATYKPGSGYATRKVTFEPVQDDAGNVALLGRVPKAIIELEVESSAAERFEEGVMYYVDVFPSELED